MIVKELKKPPEEKRKLKLLKQQLKEQYSLQYSLQDVIFKLHNSVEIRRAMRDRVIEALRDCAELYSDATGEPGSIRRKLNHYPGEISDTRLVELAQKYLIKESEVA